MVTVTSRSSYYRTFSRNNGKVKVRLFEAGKGIAKVDNFFCSLKLLAELQLLGRTETPFKNPGSAVK